MPNSVADVSPAFLIDERIITANGEGFPIAVGDSQFAVATLTLGVLESVEQQSIDVSVLRSTDGNTWDEKPILEFPQRFYAGTAAMTLDLRKHPGTAFLKARWTVNRWGRGSTTPCFRAYLYFRS